MGKGEKEEKEEKDNENNKIKLRTKQNTKAPCPELKKV